MFGLSNIIIQSNGFLKIFYLSMKIKSFVSDCTRARKPSESIRVYLARVVTSKYGKILWVNISYLSWSSFNPMTVKCEY